MGHNSGFAAATVQRKMDTKFSDTKQPKQRRQQQQKRRRVWMMATQQQRRWRPRPRRRWRQQRRRPVRVASTSSTTSTRTSSRSRSSSSSSRSSSSSGSCCCCCCCSCKLSPLFNYKSVEVSTSTVTQLLGETPAVSSLNRPTPVPSHLGVAPALNAYGKWWSISAVNPCNLGIFKETNCQIILLMGKPHSL